MRRLSIVFLLALLVGGAVAQVPGENMMGMFFDFPCISENTDICSGAEAIIGYIVLVNPTPDSVGGYEVSIHFDPESPFVLGVTGPNGWTNFGSATNHLVGYATPLVVDTDCLVLCEMQMLYSGTGTVWISFGPSEPASLPGVPVISDGTNPEILIGCSCTTPDCIVATICGDGVVATEDLGWSSVKALFD